MGMTNMMTEIEAIEKIREQICNEKGVQRYCRDNCMHGTEYCAYSMAIKALEKQIPKKPLTEYHCVLQRLCPSCGCEVSDIEDRKWSCKCGQKLDWE